MCPLTMNASPPNILRSSTSPPSARISRTLDARRSLYATYFPNSAVALES
jgi:hypothetical protein